MCVYERERESMKDIHFKWYTYVPNANETIKHL